MPHACEGSPILQFPGSWRPLEPLPPFLTLCELTVIDREHVTSALNKGRFILVTVCVRISKFGIPLQCCFLPYFIYL